MSKALAKNEDVELKREHGAILSLEGERVAARLRGRRLAYDLLRDLEKRISHTNRPKAKKRKPLK